MKWEEKIENGIGSKEVLRKKEIFYREGTRQLQATTGTRRRMERGEGYHSKTERKEIGLRRSEKCLEMAITRPRYCRSFRSKDEQTNHNNSRGTYSHADEIRH